VNATILFNLNERRTALRDFELVNYETPQLLSTPVLTYTSVTDDFTLTSAFSNALVDVSDAVHEQALFNIIRTCFLLVLLVLQTTLILSSVRNLLVRPLEQMVAFVSKHINLDTVADKVVRAAAAAAPADNDHDDKASDEETDDEGSESDDDAITNQPKAAGAGSGGNAAAGGDRAGAAAAGKPVPRFHKHNSVSSLLHAADLPLPNAAAPAAAERKKKRKKRKKPSSIARMARNSVLRAQRERETALDGIGMVTAAFRARSI
jgi:hypothetical protein